MDDTTDKARRGGPLPGLLRPPVVFLCAVVLGIVLNRAWPLNFVPSKLGMLGIFIIVSAILLFLLSVKEFRAAGTSVRGTQRTTTIVRTGPYRFSRNPIYLSFVLLLIGLAIWLDNLWLLLALVPAVAFIAVVVIPREERFLKDNFPEHYSSYKTLVRRWL
jgi:protein-S-isoprenylcysteine O-methyltransferase Ste14